METIKVDTQRRKVHFWLNEGGFMQLVGMNNLSVFEDTDNVKFVLYNGYMLAYRGE